MNNTRSRSKTLSRYITSSFGRRLRIEHLEERQFLAGDTYLINFQLEAALTPTRYAADVGEVYGLRNNGWTYGWSTNHMDVARERNNHADQRLDTLIHFHQNQRWEMALPNGQYEVTASIGDPSFGSTHTLNVEGINYWNAVALGAGAFLNDTRTVTVSDGRLTLTQGAAGEMATRINFVHVVGLPSGPNSGPATPTIMEPVIEGDIVNPADVHMEAVDFLDPEGDEHLSTDWEIWTIGTSPQRVWHTLGITGVERLHTHLGDGIFENSHAGRTDLISAPNLEYQLRVRFRDDAGAVSAYATRNFIVDEASTIFPLELEGIANLPAPTWTNANDNPIILPAASPNQSQLRIEGALGELLLSFTGNNSVTNTVLNPPTLPDHVYPRAIFVAGSNGLALGQTEVRFSDDHGQPRTVYLPTINLAPNARLDLWIAADGSTFFGTAAQTAPVFTTIARQAELPIPFIAFEPGFEIDEVAGGFQLPVNIAFVPNPGSDPDDPLFYVNELYGTIKVVSNDFTVTTYATDLLNFDPTGAFPGSGEQGLAGIVVDPISGDLFVTRVTDTDGLPGGAHHPQVVRLQSTDGGRTASTITVIRNMVGESQGQSHQISNASIGPDGKLYIHNGDGFDASTALNLNSYRGKILRMNFDGTAPSDNPLYNAANGITATDYIYAYGFRNPFGGAWRASDGKHYEVENGNSLDRIARVERGGNYDWNGNDSSLLPDARYVWNPAHAPVNITFVEPETFGGSQFPGSKQDHAFVSESGPTYALGQQTNGKRIIEIEFDANGSVVGTPTTLVEYVGVGRATVSGLIAGPDGLYFSELYKDLDPVSPIDAGARIFRVRFTAGGDADFDLDGDVDGRDFLAWQRGVGTANPTKASGDANNDNVVDQADLAIWQSEYGHDNHSHLAAAATASVAAVMDSEPKTKIIETVATTANDYAIPDNFWIELPRLQAATPTEELILDNQMLQQTRIDAAVEDSTIASRRATYDDLPSFVHSGSDDAKSLDDAFADWEELAVGLL